jgi:hypothetical protein
LPARLPVDPNESSALTGGLGLVGDGAGRERLGDHVDLLAPIKPGRERAAEPRLQFAATAAKRNPRSAARLLGSRDAVFPEIFGEIDCGLVHIAQGLNRSPFRINDVVTFDLDVEVFQFVIFTRFVAGDRCSIDQVSDWDQHAIDE